MSQEKKRKKLKDTKVGQFLIGKTGIINSILNTASDNSVLGVVKNLISNDKDLPPEDKETALKLLEQDSIEMQEVTKRWESDNLSDSYLSKNTRPMALIFLTVSMVLLIYIDSFAVDFSVDSGWIDLLKSLLITVYVSYFGSRGIEKYKNLTK
jgi:hypothetical protein